MRKIKKTLALMLSFCMVLGLFSIVPAFANETEAIENYQNITFVDETQEVSSGNSSTFEKKKKYLTVYSNLSGTELELHGMDSAFLAEKYKDQTSKIQSITYTAFKGKTATPDTLNPVTFSAEALSDSFVNMTDKNITDNADVAGTSWSSAGWWKGTNATIYEVYAANQGEDILYSQERVDAGFYDADLTLELSEKTNVESLYLFGHKSCKTSFMTYGIFLSDDIDTLYNKENQILFYDRYPLLAANGGTTQGFNDFVRSEGQVYDFKGETKAAKYVGIRMYDISGVDSHVSIYDLGVYGSTYVEIAKVPIEDALKIETDSSSALSAEFCGEASADLVAVTDAAGSNPSVLLSGSQYTFTASNSEDGIYTFAGWYNNEGTLVSSDPSYTISAYSGEALTAKYTTDYILNLKASEDIAITQKWSSAKLDGATTAFPSLEGESGWAYDAESGAMKITNPRAVTVSGGAVFTTFTLGGTNVMTSTEFEPYTTYKYTVRAKIETTGSKTVTLDPSMAVSGLLLNVEHGQSVTSDEGYKDLTVYFNSGAANYSAGSGRRTAYLSTNLFNFNIPANSSVYIESWSIEKVNDIKIVGEDYVVVDGEGNCMVDLGENSLHKSTSTGPVNGDEACYGGATTAKDCSAWLLNQLAKDGIFGAAGDNETISFTANSISGDPITEVKVNGVVIAPVDGVYTANVGAGAPKATASEYAKSDEIIINIKSEPHECLFIYKVMDEKNLVENTTDTYYKRCACGATDPEHTFKPITEYNGVDLTKNMYNQPVWNESVQYNDIIMPYIGEDEYQLLYPVDEIIAVRSYDMKTVYLEGEDFTITADGKIKLTESTTLPIYYSDNFKNENEDGTRDWNQVSAWVGYSHLYQVYFTYTHSKTWEGTTYNVAPEPELDKLTTFVEKMNKGEDTHLLFYGDSLTDGWNASGLDEDSWQYKDKSTPASALSKKQSTMYEKMGYSAIPEWACESWPKQVYNYLKTSLGNENLKYLNSAIGSTASEWGSKEENMDYLIKEQCENAWGEGVYPDIVFMGYGGNESGNTAEVQNANMKKIIDYVRSLNPDCSIVIYSCMYLNIYNKTTGEIDNNNLLGQEEGYYELIKDYENIVLVPIHSRFLSLTTAKNPIHYMSNGYNHPNDFGVRYYADVMNAVLTLPESDHTCVFDREEAIEENLASVAACTKPATYHKTCACGKKTKETFTVGGVDPTNHEGSEVAIPDIAATPDAAGTKGATKYDCCNAPAKAGTTTYYVSFVCKNTTVYSTEVEANSTLSPEQQALADANKLTGYGYSFKGWDNPITDPITANNTVFIATYERNIEDKYSLTISGEPEEEAAFDAKITVNAADDKEVLWKVNGVDFHIGKTLTAYVFGAMTIEAHELGDIDKSVPFVSLVHTVAANGEFVAFVHLYDAGKPVTEYGARYWNAANGITEANAATFKNLSVTTGSDAMATLYGIAQGKTRGVQAYAVVDGETIYSKGTDIKNF